MSGLGLGSGLKPGSGPKAKKIQAQYLFTFLHLDHAAEDYISTKQVERERDREETATDSEIHRHDRY
jgi:hypothetical protein